METQDHRKPNQSGHEAHGGAHVCHKCGWPFPNPHPSSRHKRAHRRLCGTIEGYKLNNTQENTHLDGFGGDQLVSDDEFKTPSGSAVETTISRRNSSGVGIRSNRSTRSEDGVFADAVTDFVASPGLGEVSDGVVHRENSLQNITENDPDGAELTAINGINDNSTAPNIYVENKELQTVQKLKGDNDSAEGGMPSQDCNSGSPDSSTVGSASFAIENENAVKQQIIQSSITVGELNLGVNEGNETSGKNFSELITIGPEARGSMLEDVSTLGDAAEECLDSVYADQMVKPRGLQTDDGFEAKVECFDGVGSPVENHALLESAEVIDSIDGNAGKSTYKIEEPDSKIDSNKNMHVAAAPDALCLQEHPEIAVEDLDHKRGKFNVSAGPDAAVAFEIVARGEDPVIKQSCFGTDFAKPVERSGICSQGCVLETIYSTKDTLQQDVGQSRTIVPQDTAGEANQISDAEACNADIGGLKSIGVFEDIKSETYNKEISSSVEQKLTSSLDSVSLEVAVLDGSDNQETKSSAVVNDEEHFVVHENDRSQVQVEELAATSPKVINSHDGTDKDDGKMLVEGTALNENERIGGENESKTLGADIRPTYGSTLLGSDESIVEAFEPERNYKDDKPREILSSGNVMGDHSQLGSLPTSRCISKDDAGAIVENDDHLDLPLTMTRIGVSEVLGDAGSVPSSTAIRDSCTEEVAENVSDAVEAGRTTEEHFAVSAVDTPVDSSSQTDSLEGNWGSVSVLSAISDAPAATDAAVSNTSQASAEAGTATLAPEVLEKESKTSVEPRVAGRKQKEGLSEIRTSQIKQQQSSSLQTGWSPSVTRMANDQLAGKRNEEIIAKVTNWNTEKQHTPLKTLLGEATARSRAESPSYDENLLPDHQKEEIPVTNNEFSAKTQNVVLATKEAAQEEIRKEWNSPARYPVNIKTEKRRDKHRPYWAQFLCCSSVDAAR